MILPNAFDEQNPPFDRLTSQEIETVRRALDIAYFRPGETIIAQGEPSEALYVIIKGVVEERAGREVLSLLGPKDSFDSRALVQGRASHEFLAREETLCYLLPGKAALGLIQSNPRFAAFFYLEISRKLDAMARDEEDSRVGTLMRARVSDMKLHPASFIDATDTIEAAGHRMREINTNALFVRDGARTGILTGMNLSKAVVLNRMPIEAPVGPITHFDVVSLSPDDFVYSALILMTKTNKRRVAVHDGAAYIGILEDIELLSFVTGNAQLVAQRIDRALTLADLTIASREIGDQVRLLRRQGVKIEVVAEIVSDLNRRLFAKVFDILAPAPIRARGCLVVMGSEGRGEQTARTDQDNALILAEPVDERLLEAFRRDFTAALEGFGFSPCQGNVMVRNPAWSRTLADYLAAFRRWVALPDENAHMNVAIFYDAAAVAGNAALLTEAKAQLIAATRENSAYLAHFARAIEAFPMPIGFFNNLLTLDGHGDAVDLKKGGIFPIVHGVRSLALERGLTETGTGERIQRLVELGLISRDLGRELTQSLYFLMTLRLDAQLAATGASSALVRPAELSSLQRDLLRDAFRVVKQFRDVVRRRFNLGMF
ncbi:putative nucleotidyltransferase substrate binding domain-containing protein [Methylocella tundrae]|uniref:Putative CBS domain and cyclic nucleotide-regulated nucleotidyltransferase n=1 Tax=Methylocella tundrae TaxID=227605 RepID=A0A4V6IN64_METTU|nr:putative nucleotidyltransferase substrate binding domain-containing protein [Methylocella tundrae]WPP02846.1 putative nucleotidyltransferase substrate binding domain-containing protein [Methylocella tundrae]VFU16451.1 putative CBS domain and cyclic nucleotide-regulated nucleotidyltransferase [Methylocella tundrae]